MIHEIVDQKIAEYIKSGQKTELSVWRSIKNEFLLYITSKANAEINEDVEIKILNKMVAQRKDSIEQYKSAGRNDLVDSESKELSILSSLLPKEATEDEIRAEVEAFKNEKGVGYVLSMKDMRDVQAFVKKKYANANGAVIANILKSII